jgi:hypothetical protein
MVVTKRNEKGDFIFDDTLRCYGHHDTVFRCPVCSIRKECYWETMRLLKADPEELVKAEPAPVTVPEVSEKKHGSDYPNIPYDQN